MKREEVSSLCRFLPDAWSTYLLLASLHVSNLEVLRRLLLLVGRRLQIPFVVVPRVYPEVGPEGRPFGRRHGRSRRRLRRDVPGEADDGALVAGDADEAEGDEESGPYN